VYKDSDGVFAFTAPLTIAGSTTNSSHFMWVTAHSSARHSGTAGSGVAADGSNATSGMNVRNNYTRVEWLEMKQFGGANGRPTVAAENATNVLFAQLIIYDFKVVEVPDPLDYWASYGIKGSDNSDFTARNCIIYNGSSSGIRINGTGTGETGLVENCTIYNIAGTGVGDGDGTLTVRNTISMGNTTDFDVLTANQSYNISSDSSAAGTGSMTGRTATANASPGAGDWVVFANITAGSEDFHLQDSSENDALDNGTDLSSSFTNDIDDATRPTGAGTWDIGADEYGTAAATVAATP
jgi:hypothetical protein